MIKFDNNNNKLSWIHEFLLDEGKVNVILQIVDKNFNDPIISWPSKLI